MKIMIYAKYYKSIRMLRMQCVQDHISYKFLCNIQKRHFSMKFKLESIITINTSILRIAVKLSKLLFKLWKK